MKSINHRMKFVLRADPRGRRTEFIPFLYSDRASNAIVGTKRDEFRSTIRLLQGFLQTIRLIVDRAKVSSDGVKKWARQTSRPSG